MNTRENLIAALNGRTPDRTPYSIYAWFFDHPKYNFDRWRQLFDQGLGLSRGCRTVRAKEHGVVHTTEHKVKGDRRYTINRKETPVGTLRSVTLNSVSSPRLIEWTYEEWVKEPKDYEIRRWIVEHTELVPQYDQFEKIEEKAGDSGVTVVSGPRTPAMSIMVDYAGVEKFALDVASGMEELFDLYEAEKQLFLEWNRLIADGPGRFVKWTENLSIDMLGPRYYRDLLMPIYNEVVPLLEAAGKRVIVHYDGRLKAVADQIGEAPLHIVESLTEPPEGDMMYDECRQLWPNKALWANINLDLYYLSEDKLREAIVDKYERAGKKALAFEISEDVPENWRESVPVVLQTLRELS